jgi:hypothetical protein
MPDVATDNPPAVQRGVMGKRIPNLVFVYDSGSGSEFRIQCEVTLPDEDEAAAIKKDVMAGTQASLKRAKEKVMARIDPLATATFKAIVDQAFGDNIAQAEARVRR